MQQQQQQFFAYQPFYNNDHHSLTVLDPAFYSQQTYPMNTLDFSQVEYQPEPLSSGLNKNSKKISKQSKSKSDSPSSNKSKSPKTRAVRNLWKPHEDDLLIRLYALHGPKWTLIGRLIGGRACKQVRDRYLNNLRPDINNSPFTPQEDEVLVCLYNQLGSKWKDIAERMPGRTQAQVKNRFYLHLKDSLHNYKMNPFAIGKNDSACSNSTVDTNSEEQSPADYSALNRGVDEGFGFISYNQTNLKVERPSLKKEEEEEEEEDFGIHLNLIRDTSYKFENLF